MNKIAVIAGVVICITAAGAVSYYPSYRAAQAEEIIQQEVAKLNSKLQQHNVGSVAILSHEANREGSNLEIEWTLQLPESITADLTNPELKKPITMQTQAIIDFGFLPSTKGFSKAHSITSSKDIDQFLAKQGQNEGLTFDCTTTPSSSGYDTGCTTNKLEFTNKKQPGVASEIETIVLAESELNLNLDQDNGQLETGLTIPSFTLQGKGKTLGSVENISLDHTGPYDVTGMVSMLDTMLGNEILVGESSTNLSIAEFKVHSKDQTQPFNAKNISIKGLSSVKDELLNGSATFAVEKMQGLPFDLESFTYGFQIDQAHVPTLMKFNKMNQESSQHDQVPNKDVMTGLLVDFLAEGPKLSLDFDLAQNSGDKLQWGTMLEFKPTSAKSIQEGITLFDKGMQVNPMAPLQFLTDNMIIKMNAEVDEPLAKIITSQALSMAGAQRSSVDPTQATAAPTSDQDIQKALSALEMFGVLKKTDERYTSAFELSEKGILVNGVDMSAMLGLPARSTAPKTGS